MGRKEQMYYTNHEEGVWLQTPKFSPNKVLVISEIPEISKNSRKFPRKSYGFFNTNTTLQIKNLGFY